MDPVLADLSAKAAIRDVLSRYCRGLDRMDKPMAYAVFAQDSSANYYGIYNGTGHGFIDWVWGHHAAFFTHSHQITNVLIEVDGERAVSEAYVTVVVQQQRGDGGVEMQMRGRYLDRWERRTGRWQIVAREHVIDTRSETPLSSTDKLPESRRDSGDASYQLFS